MGESEKAGLRQMMPSLFNGIATAIAAAAGLIGVLHQTGYLGNHPRLRARLEAKAREQDVTPENRTLAAADAPVVPATSASPVSGAMNPASTDAPHIHRNFAGAWRDMASNCHEIKQTGHELTVTSYGENGKLRAVGSGTVKGRSVSVRINSANPASIEADLILSEDGRELSGMTKGLKGAHVAKWRFVGPSCG
jgi:hypothetical protein